MEPALLLFPNLLAKVKNHQFFLPQSIDEAVLTIDGLIAESVQGGRSFLNRFKTKKKPNDIPIALYNEHGHSQDLDFLLEPILKGERWGLVSDAGLPCVADPGSELVLHAKSLGIKVEAFVGPSSIFLSLMLSGLPGQHFCFHGYLSKEPDKRRKELLHLEERSKKEQATQIFIEAPYRNAHTFQSILDALHPSTFICIALDLTLPTQQVLTYKIEHWKKNLASSQEENPYAFLAKTPAIFLIFKK